MIQRTRSARPVTCVFDLLCQRSHQSFNATVSRLVQVQAESVEQGIKTQGSFKPIPRRHFKTPVIIMSFQIYLLHQEAWDAVSTMRDPCKDHIVQKHGKRRVGHSWSTDTSPQAPSTKTDRKELPPPPGHPVLQRQLTWPPRWPPRMWRWWRRGKSTARRS